MVNKISNVVAADRMAEKLRQEPYVLFKNDCITKSKRLKKECQPIGIKVKVVVCIGLARANWFRRWLTIPVIHGWGEVEDKRIETSRPLGSSGIWGIVPMYIKPIIVIRF
jgi:hypothetical protein